MKRNIIILLLIALFLFGCVKEPSPTPIPVPEEITEETPEVIEEIPEEPISNEGRLNIFVSAWEAEGNVVSDFDRLEVTFNKVRIYKPQSSEFKDYNIQLTADLTELQDKKVIKILDKKLTGEYAKIKIYASSMKGILLGNEVEIEIPGEALTISKDLSIEAGKTLQFLFDIKVSKTGEVTTTTGLEKYALKPVISKSGIIGLDIFGVKEFTEAEMQKKILDKRGIELTRTIKMTSEGFAPKELTIEKGTTVKWVNEDDEQLGIISGEFDRMIRAGGSYSQTFNHAKEIEYYLKFRPSIKAKIIVVIPAAPEEEPAVITTTKRIEITSERFSPAELTVKKNTKLEWINKDTPIHNVVSPGVFEESLKNNEVFSHVFTEVGEFPFYDKYNVGKYSGKITVIE